MPTSRFSRRLALPDRCHYGEAMIRLALLCAALALLAFSPGNAGAASQSGCKSFKFKDNGVPWSAKQIRVKATSCKKARTVIRSYAHPRNCRLEAPCHIKGYICRTTDSHDSVFVETCKAGRRTIRWHGSYSSN
jgi:hypothetical protein